MAFLYLLIGIPGSGKTTYIKESKEFDCDVVSTDAIRKNNPNINEDDVWPMVYKMLGDYLSEYKSVVFDATNITPKVRKRLIDNIYKYSGLKPNRGYKIISLFFPTFYEICAKRVQERNKNSEELFLPLEVIASYGERIIPPIYEERFRRCLVIPTKKSLLYGIVQDSYQGYALYYKHGDEIIEEYSGFANINTYEPVRNKTNFRLASVSKQFIAYGILTLVEKKKLSLDSRLYDLFSNMPKYTHDITIRHLLNHTSGIMDYEDMPHTEEQISDYDVLGFVRDTTNTYFEVGSKYKYSNTGYVLLGLIIEKVAFKKLGDYMKEEVFTPLGMDNTLVNYEGVTQIEPRAYGHIREKDKLILCDQYWCSATIGDGGIYSSVVDLKKWLHYLQKIDKKPYSEMFIPNVIDTESGPVNTEYGFGLRVRNMENKKVIYHCGETIGTSTIIGYIEDLDIEFIFLSNEDHIVSLQLLDNIIKNL